MRLLLALRCFFLVLFAARLPAEARRLLPPSEPAPKAPTPTPSAENPSSEALTTALKAEHAATVKALEAAVDKARADGLGRGAVQLLAILQREARLIDFLQEDVSSYSDAQIGASVRDIHRGCKKALAEHVDVQVIRSESDDSVVRIEKGFDPSQVQLTGNVKGEPPFTGTLKHPGWRAAKLALPELPASYDPTVIAPCEVELS